MAAKKSAAKKSTASRGSGDTAVAEKPTKKVVRKPVKKTAKVVKTPAPKVAKKVAPKGSVLGANGQAMNPKTGFVVGSESDIIATELIKGGDSRVAVIDRLKGILPAETRNGSPKPVANLVSGVMRRLKDEGFEEVSSFKVRKQK
jgi:hypothetical protein